MGHKRKVLLVDDDLDDHFLLREALSYASEEVDFLSAYNGMDALELLEQLTEFPHIIFLDLNMPLMDGKECLQRLRQNGSYSGMPIIIYSTSIADPEATDLRRLGATEVLQKPADFMKLCTAIQTALSRLLN